MFPAYWMEESRRAMRRAGVHTAGFTPCLSIGMVAPTEEVPGRERDVFRVRA